MAGRDGPIREYRSPHRATGRLVTRAVPACCGLISAAGPSLGLGDPFHQRHPLPALLYPLMREKRALGEPERALPSLGPLQMHPWAQHLGSQLMALLWLLQVHWLPWELPELSGSPQ